MSTYIFSFTSSSRSGHYDTLTYGRPDSGVGNGFSTTLCDPDDTVLRFGAAVVPTVGGVPEPGSWAMLPSGLGLCGAGLRRHRAARPVYAPARWTAVAAAVVR